MYMQHATDWLMVKSPSTTMGGAKVSISAPMHEATEEMLARSEMYSYGVPVCSNMRTSEAPRASIGQ